MASYHIYIYDLQFYIDISFEILTTIIISYNSHFSNNFLLSSKMWVGKCVLLQFKSRTKIYILVRVLNYVTMIPVRKYQVGNLFLFLLYFIVFLATPVK